MSQTSHVQDGSRESAEHRIVSAKKTKFRWVVLGVLFIIYTIANADRANIGFALPYIQKEFDLSNTMAGLLVSLFFAGYAAMQIPSGFFLRKVGVTRGFALGMLLTSIATAFMGFMQHWLPLKVLRTLVGVFEAPVAIGATSTINAWFPSREKGTAAGIFLASSKLGPLLVPPFCAWVILNFTWRHIFIFCAIPGLIMSIVWYFLVRDNPSDSRFVNEAEADYIKEKGLEKGQGADAQASEPLVFKLSWLDTIIRTRKVVPLTESRQVWRCWDIYGAAMGYFFMVGTVGVLMAWLPKYLLNERGLAIMTSAVMAASPFLGTVVGNLIGGWLSDNVLQKRRKPLMLVSALSTIVTMQLLIHAPESTEVLALLLFTTGLLLSLGYSAFMVYPMGRADKTTYPVAFSVVNMGGQLGGMCMPLIVGILLDLFNWGAVFLGLSIGAMLCFFFVLSIVEPLPTGVRVIDRQGNPVDPESVK